MSLFIPYYTAKKERINKLVLSGGSSKGIAYIGVIKALEEFNFINNFKTFAGTSVGALFAFALVIGCNYDYLFKLINEINIDNLLQLKTINDYGFDNGIKIINIVKKIMDDKNIKYDITFKELFKLNNKRLIINATNLSKKKIEYFDFKKSPDMNVLIALRMSISMPLIFSPIIYNGDYYIDGGLIDNLPYCCFKNKNKCLNIYIETNININSFSNYLFALFDLISSTKNIDDLNLNIIKLNLSLVCTEFNLNINDIKNIINCGYKETFVWLNNFNF